MLSPLVVSLLVGVTPAPARFDQTGRSIGAPLSDRTASYVLEARYDPATRHVTGTARITWTNRSAVPQSTLWFHAYWNAFKNADSTFSQETHRAGGARSSTAAYRRDDWGWTELRSARLPDGTDVRSTLRWEQPDDGPSADQTVFTLTLPTPVPPHGTLTLDLGWEARVPKLVARTGVAGKFTLFGQWFPKLGVLEVPPQRGLRTPTWNCHQFHAATEFYADFGNYDASLTVPRSLLVGATGVRTGRTENPDGTVTHRFHQDDVIDFAWTAWEGAVEASDVFLSDGLPQVALTVLVPPNATRSTPQILAAARATLEHGGRRWLPYPYPHLTLVAPPISSNVESGGMEYPTFVTVYSRTDPVPPRDVLLWEVTVHEVGHGWWQGMLASNEFEEAWLDEGVDTWATAEVLDGVGLGWDFAQLAPPGARWLLAPLLRSSIPDAEVRGRSSVPRYQSTIVRPGWRFKGSSDVGRSTYGRAAAALRMLEREVGRETFARIMRTYAERWAFRHPGTDDFLQLASEVGGKDLRPLGSALLRGTAGLDDAVAELRCTEVPAGGGPGLYDVDGGTPVFRPARLTAGETAEARCEVLVERHGDLPLPLDVQLTFQDGTRSRHDVPDGERWSRIATRRPLPGGRVALAEVHPGSPPPADTAPLNDARSLAATPGPTLGVAGWLLYAAQLLAVAVGSLL
ncbi:MAG TPA: M1 family metallopeptidase [Myxococcaceae bacterium]|nr:M1 family metallopeptidase [Myxococcaceae bacterium]